MGLIRNLLNSTQDVAIRRIEQRLLMRALDGLLQLPPEIPRETTPRLVSATCDQRVDRVDLPGAEFRFEVDLPAESDERFLVLSVHRPDLAPVRLRLKNHNQALDRRCVLFQRVEAGAEGPHAAEFVVPLRLLEMPVGRHQLLALIGVLSPDGTLHVLERLSFLADVETDQSAMIDDDESAVGVQGREVMSVVVGLSMFVAFADGNVSEVEEERIGLALADLEDASPTRRKALVESLRRLTADFRYKKEVLDDLCGLAVQIMTPEARVILTHILFSVAVADGLLHPGEQKMLAYVSTAIGVPSELVDQLTDEFFRAGH
jgi:uncharacterized tellurite resistance protein B-like protein